MCYWRNYLLFKVESIFSTIVLDHRLVKKERIVGIDMIYHADHNPEVVVCYHMMTGSVNWAIALGRCDIQYAVSALSRRNMAPPCDKVQQLVSMLVSPASQLIVDPIMCSHLAGITRHLLSPHFQLVPTISSNNDGFTAVVPLFIPIRFQARSRMSSNVHKHKVPPSVASIDLIDYLLREVFRDWTSYKRVSTAYSWCCQTTEWIVHAKHEMGLVVGRHLKSCMTCL
jgi:hypothetical protein